MRRQPRRTVLEPLARAMDAHSRRGEEAELRGTRVEQVNPIQSTADWVEARRRWMAARKGEGES